MNKKEIRGLALKARVNNNDEASRFVIDEIIKSKILIDYNHIGIYYPLGKEIDITALMDIYPDKSFYLPVTRDDIYFVKYNQGDKLISGLFSTKEPVGEEVPRNKIECFIIPCVAINKNNQRIGYGKGYYDRYLEGYQGYKLGVCYKEYGDADCDCDSYDVVLNHKILG